MDLIHKQSKPTETQYWIVLCKQNLRMNTQQSTTNALTLLINNKALQEPIGNKVQKDI